MPTNELLAEIAALRAGIETAKEKIRYMRDDSCNGPETVCALSVALDYLDEIIPKEGG